MQGGTHRRDPAPQHLLGDGLLLGGKRRQDGLAVGSPGVSRRVRRSAAPAGAVSRPAALGLTRSPRPDAGRASPGGAVALAAGPRRLVPPIRRAASLGSRRALCSPGSCPLRLPWHARSPRPGRAGWPGGALVVGGGPSRRGRVVSRPVGRAPPVPPRPAFVSVPSAIARSPVAASDQLGGHARAFRSARSDDLNALGLGSAVSLGASTDTMLMPSISKSASARNTSPALASAGRRLPSTTPRGSRAPAARQVQEPSGRAPSTRSRCGGPQAHATGVTGHPYGPTTARASLREWATFRCCWCTALRHRSIATGGNRVGWTSWRRRGIR